MKTINFSLAWSLFLLLFYIGLSNCGQGYNKSKEEENNHYSNCKYLDIKHGKYAVQSDTFPTTCFVPGEIITNTSDIEGPDEETLFNYLMGRGLSVIDTCACNDKLLRWGVPGSAPGLLDVIGVIADAKTDGGPAGDVVGLNIYVPIPIPADSFIRDNKPIISRNLGGLASAKAVVMDTGVDPEGAYLSAHIRSWSSTPCSGSVSDTDLGLDVTNHSRPSGPTPDFQGHGTHVNGILVDALNTSPRVNVRVRNVKVSSGNTDNITLFDFLCGLYYALEKEPNIDVINCSLGWYDSEAPITMRHLLKRFSERGILLVAGVGNDGFEQARSRAELFWPAAFSHSEVRFGSDVVISVAAWDAPGNTIWERSNWGGFVDVAAPGVNILSSFPPDNGDLDRTVAYGTGTSMAAPFVGRLAAEIKSRDRTLTPRQVKECIINSATLRAMKAGSTEEMHVVDEATVPGACW